MLMAIVGICGKMGEQLFNFYRNQFDIIGIDIINHSVVKTYHNLEEIDVDIDVLVDFSSTDCYPLLENAIKKKIPILSGTTGYSLEQVEKLSELAKANESGFIWKANYAKGIKLFSKIIEDCQEDFSILDFVEIHATTKKDAPSGTAKVLAKTLKIPEEKIQSLRINHAPAIHEIIFSSDYERVILRHEIINKKAFIIGFDEELQKLIRS